MRGLTQQTGSSRSTTGRTISTRRSSTDFTKETGIKVVYDVFDSNEVLETKLLAGGTGYDVVVPTGSFLSRQIQAGVFQKLDKSKIPTSPTRGPRSTTASPSYDPGNEYAMN